MAAPVTTRAPSQASEAILGLYNVALSGCAGAFAAWAYTLINPIGGAVFGIAAGCANSLGSVIANSLPVNETAAKTAAHFLTFLASLGIGAFAATLAGFHITLMGAVALSLAMIPAWIIVSTSATCIGQCNAQPHV
jgi:hypothetical protein